MISGSLAAFVITVSPSAPREASMMFSVAPTLGNARLNAAPFSPRGALHSSNPPLSSITAPMLLNALK